MTPRQKLIAELKAGTQKRAPYETRVPDPRPPRDRSWVAQVTYPEDHFQMNTFTVEQWLAIPDCRKSDKWADLIRACAAMNEAPLMEDLDDGFQHDGPRVGWSPIHGTIFIFKSANNGTTCFVTSGGIEGLQDVIEP